MMKDIISKEQYKHGSPDFNIAAYPHSYLHSDGYSFGFETHWHDEYEIIYVRDGEFRFFADGQFFTVGRNQALFIDRYTIHTPSDYDAGNGSGYNCFVFGRKFLFPDSGSYIYRRSFGEIDDKFTLTQCITGEKNYEAEILRILQSLDGKCDDLHGNALPFQIGLLSIFNILLRERSYTPKKHILTAQSEIIKSALLYINESYISPLRINDIANSLNISVNHFIRLFKITVGSTPKEYIQNLRIKKAISLLCSDSRPSISEIALLSGFEDMNYFSRAFKKSTGCSPTQYLEKNAIINGD